MHVLTLEEHQSACRALSTEDAAALARVGVGRVSVTSTAERGVYEVRATQHVGSLVAGDLTVHVRPKISIENVLLLLGASVEQVQWWKERFDYAAFDDLVPALAAFFARVVEDTLRRGLIHSYRREEERLRTLRGRIDFAEQLRRPAMETPIACSYDDYTADIPLNRFLKAGLRRALRLPGADQSTRRLLYRELVKFDEVVDVPVRADLLDDYVFTRLDRHYEPACRLARLLLAGQAIADASGRLSAQAFMVDMNRVFEAFVEQRLRKALRGVLEVKGQCPTHLDERRWVVMRPDLLFRRGRWPVYVADAKYKLNDSGIGVSADYYQALAYATALSLPEALLIYCHDDGAAQPVEIAVRGSGKRLLTYRLLLTGSAEAIDGRMRGLADFILGRVPAAGNRAPQLAARRRSAPIEPEPWTVTCRTSVARVMPT